MGTIVQSGDATMIGGIPINRTYFSSLKQTEAKSNLQTACCWCMVSNESLISVSAPDSLCSDFAPFPSHVGSFMYTMVLLLARTSVVFFLRYTIMWPVMRQWIVLDCFHIGRNDVISRICRFHVTHHLVCVLSLNFLRLFFTCNQSLENQITKTWRPCWWN